MPDECFQAQLYEIVEKYAVIIDNTNFMAASENSLGVWSAIWPDFTF